MSGNHSSACVRARLRDSDGRIQIARTTRKRATQLERRARERAAPRVLVDAATGVITGVLDDSPPPLEQILDRFRLVVDPAPFDPFVPEQWLDLIERWTDPAQRTRRLLLYGPEGTGKDTLLRILIEKLKEIHSPEKTEVLSLPAEEPDRYVGHLQTKSRDLAAAVNFAKGAGRTVALYLPEIERHFAAGDYVAGWEIQSTATLRDVLDGTRRLHADYVLGSTNNLSRLGGPLTSRFEKYHVGMTAELARGILQTHWPSEAASGFSSDYVLERLYREPIAEATLASRKKLALRATDLTGFNGRFLSDLAADFRQRIRIRQRKDPDFSADEAFADEILTRHLETIVAPVAEAAGTRAIREFLVNLPDPLDLPMAVRATLDGFAASQYIAC
jgi:hypothetical protein